MSKIFVRSGNATIDVSPKLERLVNRLLDANPIIKKAMMDSIEDIYQKKTQLEHIKDLPDTYIGSIENTEHECWIHNDNKIVRKTIHLQNNLSIKFDFIKRI